MSRWRLAVTAVPAAQRVLGGSGRLDNSVFYLPFKGGRDKSDGGGSLGW